MDQSFLAHSVLAYIVAHLIHNVLVLCYFFMIGLQLVHIYRTLFCNDEGLSNSSNDISLFHTLPFIFFSCVTDFLNNSLSQLMHHKLPDQSRQL